MYSPKKVSLAFLLGGQEENVTISGIYGEGGELQLQHWREE